LLHRLDLHRALDRPVDHRVQPLDASQRRIECLKVDDRYKFIGLFVPPWRLPRQQSERSDEPPPPNSSVRKPRQPKPVLAAEASAALSDQLIAEIQRLKEEEDLALWAHRRLPAKNTLTADDARIVEAAYQVVLSALNPAVDEQGPAEPISPAQGSEGDATPMTAAPEDQRPQDQEKVTPLHKPMRRRNTAPTSHSSPRSPAWSVSARRAMPII
jgi:hypothetical protein